MANRGTPAGMLRQANYEQTWHIRPTPPQLNATEINGVTYELPRWHEWSDAFIAQRFDVKGARFDKDYDATWHVRMDGR